MRNAIMETENTQNITTEDSITSNTHGKTTTMELTTGIEVAPPIIPTTLPSYQHTQKYQDIIDFLAKPIFLNTYTFSTSANRGDQVISYNIASRLR